MLNLSRKSPNRVRSYVPGYHQIWLVSFLNYDLGFFDRDEGRIEPAPNPFAPENV